MAPKMESKWRQNGPQTLSETVLEDSRSRLKNRLKKDVKKRRFGTPKETPFGAILGFDRGSKKRTIGASFGHPSGISRVSVRGGLGEPPGKVRILRS